MDTGMLVIIVATLALFVAALFVHGLTQGMLIEAAVFLVSVKLMVMAYQTHESEKRLMAKLDEVLAAVRGRQA